MSNIYDKNMINREWTQHDNYKSINNVKKCGKIKYIGLKI